MKFNYDYLTSEEKIAVLKVQGGADITCVSLASTLRSVEEKQEKNGHRIIDICSPMGEYGVSDSYPYFGCIAL